jgi:hypothetical protein
MTSPPGKKDRIQASLDSTLFYMLPQWTYSEVIDRLEALKEYLIKLKVRAIPDRLLGAIADLHELNEAHREGRTAELKHRTQDLVWCVVEGWQLASIFEGISDYDPKILKKQLLKALRGPRTPIDESTSSNVGRNTLFELLLGAQFRRAGANITIGQEADLRLDYNEARLYVECKRPLFAHSIPANVARARHQLQYRFKSERRTNRRVGELGGLVAISISKALNSGEKWFVVDDENGLQSLGNDIARIRRLYPDDHNSQGDHRLIGIFYHLFTPAYVRSTKRLTCATETHLFVVKESLQESFPVSAEPLKQMLQNLKQCAQ